MGVGLMRMAHWRRGWVCPGWPWEPVGVWEVLGLLAGSGWPARCWTLPGLLGVALFGRRGRRAPGCDEKMEQIRDLEVRRAQLDGFANSPQQQRAPSRPLLPPRKAKAGCRNALLQVQRPQPASQAAKQLWAIGAGDGELGNKVEALGRTGAEAAGRRAPARGRSKGRRQGVRAPRA